MNRLFYYFWFLAEALSRVGGRLLQNVAAYSTGKLQNYPALIKLRHEKAMIAASVNHNMALHPDEDYYRRQYWHWIAGAFSASSKTMTNPLIIDLGCGQGRLTIQMAQWASTCGGRIVGVDISQHAVDFAQKNAVEQCLSSYVEYVHADILSFLKGTPSNSCNVIVCTEVLYMVPEYKEVLGEVRRVLNPGGLFLAGFRSRYFNIIHSINRKLWNALPTLLTRNEGFPWGPVTRFSWFSSQDVHGLLEYAGFVVNELRGIGTCSGIEGDPLACIAQPSHLNEAELEALMEVELQLSGAVPDCGRYIFVTASKIKEREH